ncbi:MAG: hypothetical protein ACTTKN_05045 [Phocaeicola sp.]|uniref:hypothetical protein n=1 Tax=Phocaeicola TaxID=909656 RepID=UPI00234E94ED|nr:hypothetical protein [Phocaeicola oris]MCE2616768.1 hypothetical protein [Phocaeicola oris]
MKAKISIKRLLPFLLMATLMLGVSCRKDDDEEVWDGCKKIELNMDDHRFESLPTINCLQQVRCDYRFVDMFFRSDSIFISYYGVLLYPIRLPDGFTFKNREASSLFSGEVKQKSKGTDYYPIVLTEFKYEYLIQNGVLNTKIK